MTPRPYQLEMAAEAFAVMQKYGLVYLSAQERVGKTLPAILVCEKMKARHILVLTKKAAVDGWYSTLKQFSHTKHYTVTNYHRAPKIIDMFDLVILDEAHNYISSFPKTSKLWASVRKLTVHKPLIYVSATPCAQGYQLLYHQFALSSYTPYADWPNPYGWFKEFGIPDSIWISGKEIQQYKKVEAAAWDMVKHLFITKTREEVGFEHEPEDKLHYIKLNEKTRAVYNIITKKRVIRLNGEDLICDTVGKLRTSLHMIEGGCMIINEGKKRNYFVLGNTEKIDYIKDTWGDSDKLVIMYNYIAERKKLEEHFKHASILQATTYAEGVDLHMYDHLVIYSQDFSTARHTQRRARQTNKLRDTPIEVHFLVVKKAISEQVYQAVSVNKTNYVDKLYANDLL